MCGSCEAGSFPLDEPACEFMVTALGSPLRDVPRGRRPVSRAGRARDCRDARAPRARAPDRGGGLAAPDPDAGRGYRDPANGRGSADRLHGSARGRAGLRRRRRAGRNRRARVLAEPNEDIFHGLVVVPGPAGMREVEAADVRGLYEHGVDLAPRLGGVSARSETRAAAPAGASQALGRARTAATATARRERGHAPESPSQSSSSAPRRGSRRATLLAARGPLISGAARRTTSPTVRCARRSSATATGSSTRKSFRRLTHKTQVFVAPTGDHYRTRLTHTLEVTTISRTVARALALNEDLTEAIGLGHDLGHAPFGHIGEEALDACLKRDFGRDFRHYEHSLRIVEQLERDGRGLNLTEQVRDGILVPLQPRAAARDARGADRADHRPRRLHQPRHRRRRARRPARRGRAAGRRDRGARRRRARSASTGWCTTWSSTPQLAGDIVQGAARRAGDGRTARLHVRARLSRRGGSRRGAADHERRRRAVRALRRASRAAARRRRRRGPRDPRDRLPGRNDRPLLHPRVHRACRCRAPSPASVSLWRSTPATRAIGSARRSTSSSSSRPAPSCGAPGPTRYEGLCPFHDERTPSFGIDPVAEGLPLLRLRRLRRRVHVRPGDRGHRLQSCARAARRALPRQTRARGRRRRRSRATQARASGSTRCSRATAAFYARYLWEAGEASRHAPTSRAAASRRRCCASSRSVSRRTPGTACSPRPSARATASRSCSRPDWRSARASPGAPSTASEGGSCSR